MNKRKKIIINAVILTLTSMLLSSVTNIFRVYLSRKIGAEGMGLFQIIMGISSMGATFAVSGVRVTVTRLIAEELGKGNSNKIKSIMSKAVIYCLFFSILTTAIFYRYAEFISIAWIKDARAIIPLKILSIGLPFIALSACFHGYFYGTRQVVRSVFADVFESLTMMGIIIYFLSFALPKGLEYTCSLFVIGMCVGNLASTIFCYLSFMLEERKNKKYGYLREKSSHFSFFRFASISFPIGCTAYVQTGLKTVEDILIPNSLRQFGASGSTSLALFGMIKGMVLPILYFPQIFLASFSTLIIPEIAEANAVNRKNKVNYIIGKTIKFTLLIAIFSTGMFMIFSSELGIALFNSKEAGVFIKVLAPLIPLMYLDRIVDGSLNALDQQMSTLKFNLIDMAARIFMILFLIPRYGVNGFVFVIFASTTLNASLSIHKLFKVTKLDFKFRDWLFGPTFCVVISCFIAKFMFNIFNLDYNLILLLTISLALYFVTLFLVGCIRVRDIRWFTDVFKNDIKNFNLKKFNFKKINFDDFKIYKEL